MGGTAIIPTGTLRVVTGQQFRRSTGGWIPLLHVGKVDHLTARCLGGFLDVRCREVYESLDDVALRAGLSRATLARRIPKLIEKGYLKRIGRRGRRTVSYQPTDGPMDNWGKHWLALPNTAAADPKIPPMAGAVLAWLARWIGPHHAVVTSAAEISAELGPGVSVHAVQKALQLLQRKGWICRKERVDRRWAFCLLAPLGMDEQAGIPLADVQIPSGRSETGEVVNPSVAGSCSPLERIHSPSHTAEDKCIGRPAVEEMVSPKTPTGGPKYTDMRASDMTTPENRKEIHRQAVERGESEDTPEERARVNRILKKAPTQPNPPAFARKGIKLGWTVTPSKPTGQKSRPADHRNGEQRRGRRPTGHIERAWLFVLEWLLATFSDGTERRDLEVVAARNHGVRIARDPRRPVGAVLWCLDQVDMHGFNETTTAEDEDRARDELKKYYKAKRAKPPPEVEQVAAAIGMDPDHVIRQRDLQEQQRQRKKFAALAEAERGAA